MSMVQGGTDIREKSDREKVYRTAAIFAAECSKLLTIMDMVDVIIRATSDPQGPQLAHCTCYHWPHGRESGPGSGAMVGLDQIC